MAAITLIAHQAGRIRGWLETALAVLQEMLDAFVSYRARLAVSQAEHVHPRQLLGASSLLISGR
jgi:hypothetical protein